MSFMSVRLSCTGNINNVFLFFFKLKRNNDKSRFALSTPSPTIFILKQVHSGKKAIWPNFHWDIPALLENMFNSQVLLRPISNMGSTLYNSCFEYGAISF